MAFRAIPTILPYIMEQSKPAGIEAGERDILLNIIHKTLRHREPGYSPLQARIYSVATQIYWGS